MILQPQWSQDGAMAWMAHSKLSNTCVSPPRVISIVLSYSLPHTSHWGMGLSSARSPLRYPEKDPQFPEHLLRRLEHVVVGVAAELVPPRPGFPFALAVLLPGVAGAVVAVAVELDGEVVGGPAAVDPLGSRGLVGFRERQVGFGEQLQEL